MTAKHKSRSRLRSYSVLESLGFTETPITTYSTPTGAPRPTAPSRPSHTRLVSTTNTPAHTVEELWNTTELETASLTDWAPVAIEPRIEKRFRWPYLVSWVFIFAVVAGGGFWLWQNQGKQEANAAVEVQTAGVSLADTLAPLTAAADSLNAGAGPVDPAVLSSAASTDDAGRALFSAAAGLPPSRSSTRAIASDSATLALEASGNLTRTGAYVAAVVPLLTAPTLTTDPELVDLATATTDFGGWRARYELMISTLPDGFMSTITDQLRTLDTDLEGIQTSYLDGLREDDQSAALSAVRELEGRLADIWISLEEQTEAMKTSILGQIQDALDTLVSLTG